MTVEIKVPTLGESVTEATIATWNKQVGEAVEADEIIAELETDKVTVEVYSPVAGVLTSITANEGDSVGVDALLGVIDETASASTSATATKTTTDEVATPAITTTQANAVMPAGRKLAGDNNINTDNITGTGKGDRVTKQDVQNAINQGVANQGHSAKSTQSEFPFTTPDAPRETRIKMSRLRQSIARRLKDAQNTAAMLTTFNEIDMSAVMALRSKYKDDFIDKHDIKLGFMGFFIKVAVAALQDIPAVNAEIDGAEIVYKNFYDISVAVGTDAGLVVPVVRNCDKLSLAGVEQGIADVAKKARAGKLSMADMQGGTFTITNGGVYGSLLSTPIINPPQSGILGLHKIQKRPIEVNGEVKIRPMMYVALSYDHRIIDGKEAVTFLVRIKEAMEDPQRLLLNL
jgi:2-oxoglutarate dehydrogenase E2 component (dihydrolipoamide succinyltransferase)